MEFEYSSHRFGMELISSDSNLKSLWDEISDSVTSISWDEVREDFLGANPREISVSDLGEEFQGMASEITFHGSQSTMSLSKSINNLLKSRFKERGWIAEAGIFQGEDYRDKIWRLDFSKVLDVEPTEANHFRNRTGMAVEVGFNHGEAIAWNLLKPKIAAELNHVQKRIDIGDGVGVMICATRDLKDKGAFDSAVGEYEKVLRYLKPLQDVLSVPMVIVGLKAPTRFKVIKHNISKSSRTTNIGVVVDL